MLCEGFLAPALNLKLKVRITKLCQSDGERPGGVIHALNVLPNSGYGCQWHDALLCCVQGMLHFSGMLSKKSAYPTTDKLIHQMKGTVAGTALAHWIMVMNEEHNQ